MRPGDTMQRELLKRPSRRADQPFALPSRRASVGVVTLKVNSRAVIIITLASKLRGPDGEKHRMVGFALYVKRKNGTKFN